jgi:predicted metal-dependent enzyme (double-stranded beta helix superfamily)
MTRAIDVDHLAIARSFAADPYEWPVAPRFNPAEHWSTRLADAAGYEVWLQTWLPGQCTDLHEHPEAGAMYVYRGVLEEFVEADAFGAPSLMRSVPAGLGLHLSRSHCHRIANRSTRPAVSVHVYARA